MTSPAPDATGHRLPASVRRERITHPRTDAARSLARQQPAQDIDEQTPLGGVYILALVRSQRRLALSVCAIIAIVLGAILLLGAFAPGYSDVRLAGIPLPWLVLGLFVYPVLIGLGWVTVRTAERTERDFLELVRHR